MKKIIQQKHLFLMLFITFCTHAQVGIGTTVPNGALDISSSTDGLLIPRVALVNTTTVTVVTGTVSELVYNTAISGDVSPGYYYLSTNTGPWIRLATGNPNTDWSVTGNAGLLGTTNFLGTTDNVDVAFRRNNLVAGRIGSTSTSYGVGALTNGSASNSTAIGNNALSVSTGNNNVAVGQNALQNSNTTAQWNTAVGTNALRGINVNSAQNNVAVGFGAMSLGTGNINQSTAVGSNAMLNSTASNGTAVGYYALGGAAGSTTGADNTAIGLSSLRQNTTGSLNTSVGSGSMEFSGTGSNNVGIGFRALRSGGGNSVGVGANALNANTGANNTAIGFQAGGATTTGTGNVFVGYLAGSAEAATSSDKLYISNSATNATTSLIYGEFSPLRILRTNSTFQIGDPAGTGYQFPVARGGDTQILQTDATGQLNWVDPSSLTITEVDPKVSSTTANVIPKWNGTNLVDGIVADDGTNVTIAGNTITTTLQMTNGANANYILQSDASGNATWVPNPLTTLSAMRINLSTNQTLGTAGWEKINFDTAIFDTKSEFAGGTFTAATAGIYQVNAGFHTDNQSNGQFYSIGIYVNGGLYQETTGNHHNNGPVYRNINCMVNLASGDTVEIYVQNYQSSVAIDSFATKTFFEVSQIR